MKTLEWRFIDKSTWPSGPWHSEPDKIQWTDEATGLPCLIVRNRLGALCGYVGVTDGHPAFQKDYDKVDVDVHGGLSFSDACQPDHEHGICHIPEPGEPDDVWWLGFDCGHYNDLAPGLDVTRMLFTDGIYRDMAYVRGECASLAQQLEGAK